jgi:hypothetical protein
MTRIKEQCDQHNIAYVRIAPEQRDVSLKTRGRRANNMPQLENDT